MGPVRLDDLHISFDDELFTAPPRTDISTLRAMVILPQGAPLVFPLGTTDTHEVTLDPPVFLENGSSLQVLFLLDPPVNRPPVIQLWTGDIPLSGIVRVGSTITLSGNGSTDPDGEALQYSWDTDNRVDVDRNGDRRDDEDLSGRDVQFVVRDEGVVLVTLSVTDGMATVQGSVQLIVTPNHRPVAMVEVPGSIDLGDQAELSANGSFDLDEDPLVYSWDLGDGTVLNSTDDIRVVHIYIEPGFHTVVLSVSDGENWTSTTAHIEVAAPPLAQRQLIPPEAESTVLLVSLGGVGVISVILSVVRKRERPGGDGP